MNNLFFTKTYKFILSLALLTLSFYVHAAEVRFADVPSIKISPQGSCGKDKDIAYSQYPQNNGYWIYVKANCPVRINKKNVVSTLKCNTV
ncbi:MAG: hypothetical protein V4525_11760 [Pseudomonadota bacterium]